MLSLVLLTHHDKGIFIFLPVFPALFAPVGDHFVPVAFAVDFGPGFEYLFFLHREGSPSLADELAEFLEVVLLAVGRRFSGGVGEAALSLLSKIEVVGGKRTLGERIDFILRLAPIPLLSFLLVNNHVAAAVAAVTIDYSCSGIGGTFGVSSVAFCHSHYGRIRTIILSTDWWVVYNCCTFSLFADNATTSTDEGFFFLQEFVNVKEQLLVIVFFISFIIIVIIPFVRATSLTIVVLEVRKNATVRRYRRCRMGR